MVYDISSSARPPAIPQASSVAECHAAHAALAEVLADDPDRRVAPGGGSGREDPVLASELKQQPGAQLDVVRTTAAAAFERATDFVDDPVRRALLLRAAKEAIELAEPAGAAAVARRGVAPSGSAGAG
jgi:hypothetical protein